MLPKVIERTWFRPEKDAKKINETQLNRLVRNLPISSEFSVALKDALLTEKINPELQSLYSGINKWMWDNYGARFCSSNGNDLLQQTLDNLLTEVIEIPVEVELSETINWRAGDFGDPNSCYFSQNSITRLYLNSRPDFRAIKIYKDGKGFGRALALLNLIPDSALVYNAYPGHENAAYLEFFAQALASVTQPIIGNQIHSKIITIKVKGQDGWFYTNTGKGILLTTNRESLKEELVTIEAGNRPSPSEFKNLYVGNCNCCGTREIYKDIPYVIKNKTLPSGREITFQGCDYCLRKTLNSYNSRCKKCDKTGIFMKSIESQVMDEYMKPLQHRTGDMYQFCTECYNTQDRTIWSNLALDELLGITPVKAKKEPSLAF